MDEQARALVTVAALLMGASSSLGFVGGRMTAPEPAAEVRLVRLPPRIVRMPIEAAPIEPSRTADAEPAPATPAEPAPLAPPVRPSAAPPAEPPKPPAKVEAKQKPPPPKPVHKAQPKPQPKPEQPIRKPRPPAQKALPSCAVIKREYETMTYAQQLAAYYRASPEEIAHGKRCLGM